MGKNDFVVVIGIILLIIFAWVVTGGPGRVTSTSLFTTPSIPAISIGTFTGERPEEESQIGQAEKDLDVVRRELQRIALLGDPSPLRGKVTIRTSNFGPESTQVGEEFVELRVDENLDKRILLTGWRLESPVTGKGATIGEAALFPAANNISNEEPVFIESGQRIIVATGRSPVGTSFRTNICTGYLEQFQDFSPDLDESCPLPEDELTFAKDPLTEFDSTCIEFIEQIPQCTFELGEIPLASGNECRTFIANELTYRGCLDNHKNDNNFFGDEWRIFLGRDTELWKESRDVIRLLDAEGKVVDVFSY